ncbi:MAG: GspMb/PilO family protein [Planctomycetota bacterium]
MKPASLQSLASRLTPAHVHALGSGVLVVLAGLVYLLGVGPMQHAREAARAQEVIAAAERAAAVQRAEEMDALRTRIAELRRTLRLDAQQPAAIAAGSIFQRLSDGAEDCGLVVRGVDTMDRREEDGLLRTRMLLQGAGRLEGLIELIGLLEDDFPDVAVDHVTVSRGTSAEQPQVFQLGLSRYSAPSAGPEAGRGGSAPGSAPPAR